MHSSNPVLLKIAQKDRRYTKTEKAIYLYFSEKPADIALCSITEISERIGVSEAAITRFSKKAGYSGFNELKLLFAHGQAAPSAKDGDSPLHWVLTDYVTHIQDMASSIDENLVRTFVKQISKSSRIKFYSCGPAGFFAQFYAFRLKCIGYAAQAFTEGYTIRTDAVLSQPNELVIGISLTGTDPDVLFALKAAKKRGALTTALTNFVDSPLAQAADLVQVIPTRALLTTGQVISPQAAVIFLGDYLYTRIMMNNMEKCSKIKEIADVGIEPHT